jgi:hypothetical protein
MKTWWKSKTLWVNILSILALFVAELTGVTWLSAETQILVLSAINIVLRALTDKGLVLTEKQEERK